MPTCLAASVSGTLLCTRSNKATLAAKEESPPGFLSFTGRNPRLGTVVKAEVAVAVVVVVVVVVAVVVVVVVLVEGSVVVVVFVVAALVVVVSAGPMTFITGCCGELSRPPSDTFCTTCSRGENEVPAKNPNKKTTTTRNTTRSELMNSNPFPFTELQNPIFHNGASHLCSSSLRSLGAPLSFRWAVQLDGNVG